MAMGLPYRGAAEPAPVSDGIMEADKPEGYYTPPLINVIKFACNACDEKKVHVTDGCQGCLAHPCMEVCPKKAISLDRVTGKSIIDQDACIKCGRCATVCSYNAIIVQERPCAKACGMKAITSDENGKATIDYDKCVKQFLIAAGGTIITFFIPALLKRVKSFRNMGWIYCITGITLLLAVLFCTEVFGANLVLTLGPVSVQPGEFVKILFVMFVASMFNKSTSFEQTVKVTVIAAIHVIILVISKDLGAALIFFVVYLMMLFIATRKLSYVGIGFAAGSVAAAGAYKIFNHVRQRVLIWKDPWSTIDSTGYQICQSLFAIGMGSWFGSGLAQGLPDKIPVAEKDFMFSAITEEFGAIFAVALLLICLNNLILMMNIASRCKTLFYRLVAVGLGVTYGFQVFLTVGGAMKMIPMTGVTLPFVSYGGSSIVSSLIMFALINGMYNMRQDEVEIKNESAGKNTKLKKEKHKT